MCSVDRRRHIAEHPLSRNGHNIFIHLQGCEFMTAQQQTKSTLLAHYRQYPLLQVQDVFKFIHQSAFGCEHLLTDFQTVLHRICTEAEENKTDKHSPIESLDGDFCRVHLSVLQDGLGTETLAKIFMLSATPVENAAENLQEKLQVFLSLCKNNELPFAAQEVQKQMEIWQKNDFCACRHSDIFRTAYNPSYRVIKKEYARLLPLLSRIDNLLQEDKDLHIAVDGGAASGKTTLAAVLEQLYDCTVFHMDDFFLRPEQRTPERFAEAGGNADRERFLQEVLAPLKNGQTVQYRRFDCQTFTLCKPKTVVPKKLCITEGSYSCHEALAPFYDLTVFLDIDPDLQKQRILTRNGKTWGQRFFDEWIPMENTYFEKTDIRNRCDIIIKI